MHLIFISDLHLEPNSLGKNQLFYHRLKFWQQEKIDGLYILGDFFDYYLGDDDLTPFMREMIAQLKIFSAGIPVYFIGGNHDFAVNKAFSRETGVKLLKDLSVIKVDNKNILLSHGDVFCSLDLKYQKMKRFLQNPVSIFLLRRLPLKYRYQLKDYLENKSKANYKPLSLEEKLKYQVVDSTILKFVAHTNADVVIHGHTHRPGVYKIKRFEGVGILRYEIPDWQDNIPGGYLEYKNCQFQVKS